MFAQELDGAYAVYGVGTVEKLEPRLRRETHLVVKLAHEGVFEGNPLVDPHWVVMASLDHEGPLID